MSALVPLPPDPAQFSDQRKRIAAQVLAEGGGFEEAATEAGVHRDTLLDWRSRRDPEYVYWFRLFERDDIHRVAAEGRNRQRAKLRERLGEMDDEQRERYCHRHKISGWQLERLIAAEQDRVVRVANRASALGLGMLGLEQRAQAQGELMALGGRVLGGMLETEAPRAPWEIEAGNDDDEAQEDA